MEPDLGDAQVRLHSVIGTLLHNNGLIPEVKGGGANHVLYSPIVIFVLK